jgi:hypothetical protein
MTIEVKDSHFKNALEPICVTLFGMVTEDKEEQE